MAFLSPKHMPSMPMPSLSFLERTPTLFSSPNRSEGTPVKRKEPAVAHRILLRDMNDEEGEESHDSDEFVEASAASPPASAWRTPMRKLSATTSPSPWRGGRGMASGLDPFAFGSMPAFPSLPYAEPETKTPETKCKPGFFTPPPAPSLERQQREMEDDVQTALKWNSVPMLSLSLLRGGRTCRCRFDHSLHEAVNQPHLAALEFLLRRGVKESINEPCGGQPPLVRAVRMARNKGDVGFEMARLLLEHGAQPNMVGTSPLHEAAACACPASVSLLCSYGADLNAQDGSGRTPLHMVCKRTLFTQYTLQDEVVKILLAHGADPTLRDHSGFRASAEAADAGSICSFDGCPARTELRERLLRAERWWTRRPALLARYGTTPPSGPPNIICRLPTGIFQAVVCFL